MATNSITGEEYKPPIRSTHLFYEVTSQLKKAIHIPCPNFKRGGQHVYKLPSGAIYFEGLLDLDMDGSKFAKLDPTGQSDTSLHTLQGKPLDSNVVPFYVMPMHWYQPHGIKPSDIAAVIYKDRIEFAIFGDVGPPDQMGEGSLALHRTLGHETVSNGHVKNEAIDSGVVFIVFPGTGAGEFHDGTMTSINAVRIKGKSLLTALERIADEELAESKPPAPAT